MTLGEKLKSLRTSRDWTQPQAAEAIGVEQSYLSKLENNHSVPSSEVFGRILQAFSISVIDMIRDLDVGSLEQLHQIPDVHAYLSQREYASTVNRKRWNYMLIIAVASGAAFIYAGVSHLFFPDVVYLYQSSGVIHEGEKELFREPGNLSDRLNEHYLTSSHYRGDIFNVPMDGGSRTYHLTGETKIDPWQNKAVTFFGIFLVTFGFLGLLAASTALRTKHSK